MPTHALHAAEAAEESGKVYAWLVTITHAALAQTIRAVYAEPAAVGFDPDAPAPVILNSRGEDFTLYPFVFRRPSQSDDLVASAMLAIQNVDQSIVTQLRAAQAVSAEPPQVSVEKIDLADPDVVEESYVGFDFTSGDYGARDVTGALSVPDLSTEPYPYQTFTLSAFPGLV